MIKYAVKRLLWMIPILLGVVIIVFTLMYVTPGDTATIMLGDSATPESKAAFNEEYGLNEPYIVQLGNYIKNLFFHLDMGKSYRTGQPVMDEILTRLPNTLKLASLAMVLAVIIGVVTGIISAVKQYTLADNIATGVALFGVSMPPFWLGLLLILAFSVKLDMVPSVVVKGQWNSWILPTITLGTAVAGIIMRMTRSSMLDVIRQDYIRTARAKGVSGWRVIFGHALKNSLIPVITYVGPMLAYIVTGSLVVEQIFAVPGIGRYFVSSITGRDYPLIMGTTIVLAVLIVVMNLVSDILYKVVDPRITLE